jgi:hypothetical protein
MHNVGLYEYKGVGVSVGSDRVLTSSRSAERGPHFQILVEHGPGHLTTIVEIAFRLVHRNIRELTPTLSSINPVTIQQA